MGAIVLIPSSQQVTTLGLGSNSWVERYFEDGGLIVCDTRWLSYPVIKAESTSVCGLSLRIISSTFWINCVEHRMCSVKVLPLNWHYSKRPMHQDISIDKYIIVTDLNHLKGIEISKMLIRLPINKRLILQIFWPSIDRLSWVSLWSRNGTWTVCMCRREKPHRACFVLN